MQNAVRSLLDYSRQRVPTPEALDPASIVSASLQLVAPAARKKDLKITNQIASNEVTPSFTDAKDFLLTPLGRVFEFAKLSTCVCRPSTNFGTS